MSKGAISPDFYAKLCDGSYGTKRPLKEMKDLIVIVDKKAQIDDAPFSCHNQSSRA